MSTGQRQWDGTGNDALPDQAMGFYYVADHSVGPYCEALSWGAERLGFAVGKRGTYHGMYCGPRGPPRQLASLVGFNATRSTARTARSILRPSSATIFQLNDEGLVARFI